MVIFDDKYSGKVFTVLAFQQAGRVFYGCAGWKNQQGEAFVEVDNDQIPFAGFGIKCLHFASTKETRGIPFDVFPEFRVGAQNKLWIASNMVLKGGSSF